MHGFHEVSWRELKRVHDAIDAHYVARGVPANRIDELRWRWLRTKGLRVPGGTR